MTAFMTARRGRWCRALAVVASLAPWSTLGCSSDHTGSGGTLEDAASALDASLGTADGGDDARSDAAHVEPNDGGGALDAASSDGDAGALSAGSAAAQKTAHDHAACVAIAPFYWEIGDVHGALVSGSVAGASGTPSYDASSRMEIASASKLYFGAYIVERFKDHLEDVDLEAMTMRSGYSNFSDLGCVTARPATVQGCFDGGTKNKTTPDPSTLHAFAYDSGHFQKYAVDLGLGALDDAGLAAEYAKLLGENADVGFKIPLLAGGMQATPRGYARFLRKILAGKLAIRDHLGEQAVCTLPPKQGGGSCAATYSPASPYAWHYSYGHWVEDDTSRGDDGAFSSAGKFGFYPWIDANKTYYGIVARKSSDARAGMTSAECGRLIRKAFMTGVAP